MFERTVCTLLAAALAAIGLSTPPASAQPLGSAGIYHYVMGGDFRCYQVDPLRNYRVWVSFENCVQPRMDLNLTWVTGWAYVTQVGDDWGSTLSTEITTVHGLDANQGSLDPMLAGLNPADPEFTPASDERIISRHGTEYTASSFQTVPIIQLPDLLPGHDLSMIDFSDPFSVVHVFRTYAPMNEIYFPCPADMNNDGVLDLFDISSFLNAFVNQQFAADFDGNNIFDLSDINAYVHNFTTPCP